MRVRDEYRNARCFGHAVAKRAAESERAMRDVKRALIEAAKRGLIKQPERPQ